MILLPNLGNRVIGSRLSLNRKVFLRLELVRILILRAKAVFVHLDDYVEDAEPFIPLARRSSR